MINQFIKCTLNERKRFMLRLPWAVQFFQFGFHFLQKDGLKKNYCYTIGELLLLRR